MRAPHLAFLLAAGFALTRAPSHAQAPADSTKPRKGEVSVQLEMPYLGMGISRGDLAKRISYEPNNPPGFKLGLRYGGFGGSVGYSSGRLREEYPVTTQSSDLQVFWHRPRFGLDLIYQTYKGYLIEGEASRAPVLFPDMRMSTQTANLHAKILGTSDLTALSSPGSFRDSTVWLVYLSTGVSRRTASYVAPPTGVDETTPPQWTSSPHLDAIVPSASIGIQAIVPLGRFYFAPGLGIGLGQPFELAEPPADMERAAKFNLRMMTGSVSPSGEWGLHAFIDSDLLEYTSGTTFQFSSLKLRLFKSWKF